MLLTVLRGERASEHEQMTWMETGDMQKLGGGTAAGSRLDGLGVRLFPGWFQENHITLLTMLSEAVEIAKLPPEAQRTKFQALEQKAKSLSNSNAIFARMSIPPALKVAEASHRTRTELRCAVVALAVERYRRANDKWPDSLDQLVPGQLKSVPLDLYDGKPLRYKRLEDGVLIYSVGPDGKDDGGKINRKDLVAPGTDMGFRLWNPDRRRQPPPTS